MKAQPNRATPFANFTTLRLAAVIAALCMAAALFLSACGGDESALPPADSSATAGSAAGTDAGGSTSGAAATAAPSTDSGSGATSGTTSGATSGTSSGGGAAAPAEPLNVVASNVVLADLVAQVGGDRVSIHSLVPAGSDVHSWQSSPQDSVRIAEADVIVSNGAELAAQVDDLIESAASADAVQVVASEGLEAQELVELPFPEGDHDDHGHDDHHDVELEGRLLIGDGEGSGLTVIELHSGEVHQNEFDLGSRAGRIYPTTSGRFAIAVSSDANNVTVLDGGIYLEEHGDHFDLVEAEASAVNLDLSGDRPVHMYISGEWAAIYYDGSGDIVLINEHELEHDGDSYTPTILNAGPHHGAAIPLEDDLFAVTIQHPDFDSNPQEYRLPIGAEIWDLHGHALYTGEAACPDLHGDAGNGHMAVFGCTGGVLAIEAHDGHYEDWFIEAPAGSPDDFRLTSVWGYHDLHHFFAMGSSVGLYIVEPEDGFMEQLIPATDSLRPIQVAISHDGELLIVVMSDGEIRVYDAHDADLLVSSNEILSDNIETGFWARPHIATAPDHIFITDSTAGEVIALDAHDLEEVNHWEVDGLPTKIAFVGVLGEGEHEEEGHDDHGGHDAHGHGHGHGHDHGAGDPHFWQNPRMAVHYVNQIADGLMAADPDNASVYRDNAAAYVAELEALDAYIADALAGIPDDHRVIVTFHDAFGYFASRYDMEVMAFVGGHGGDVSPDDIVRVLHLVEDKGLPAVFAEPQFSADALEQVARDAGVAVGLIRALTDKTYPQYIDMMRANADALAELLR